MTKVLRRYVWIHLVVIVVALAAFGDSAVAQGPKRSHNLRKLDGWLKATVDSRTTQAQRVIIRVQPGYSVLRAQPADVAWRQRPRRKAARSTR